MYNDDKNMKLVNFKIIYSCQLYQNKQLYITEVFIRNYQKKILNIRFRECSNIYLQIIYKH